MEGAYDWALLSLNEETIKRSEVVVHKSLFISYYWASIPRTFMITNLQLNILGLIYKEVTKIKLIKLPCGTNNITSKLYLYSARLGFLNG